MTSEKEWQPIETAPFGKPIIAAIHHGSSGYMVVQAVRCQAGVFDTRVDSCVGWRPGYEPAFWQPMPTFDAALIQSDTVGDK